MNEYLQTDEGTSLPVRLVMLGDRVNQETVRRETGFLYHQFLYVMNGTGVLEDASGVRRMERFHCYFLERGTPHSYYGADTPFTTLWISFEGDGADRLISYCHMHGNLDAPYHAFPDLHGRLRSLMLEHAGAERMSALVYQMIVEYGSALRDGRKSGPVERGRAYLQRCFTRDVSLEDAAAAAGVSKYSFCRMFRESYGLTPLAYVTELRIRRAKLLLADEPQMSAREVGESVGFHDAAYFGKRFRQYTNMTPQDYRRLWL